MHNPTDIVAQAREAAEAEEARQLQLLGERADIMWIMGDARGRRIVARILDSTGLLSASFAADARTTDYLEGRRSIGIRLLEQLQQHAPREYMLMLQERLSLDEE